MRPRDLVPLGLLVGIAAFLAVQIAQRPVFEPRPPAPPPVEQQGTDPVRARAPAPAPVAAVTSSSAPAPVRDETAIEIMLRDIGPGTYIQAMLQQQNRLLTRWPDRQREALRVWIQRDAKVANWDPQYPVVAGRAFDEWREAGFPMRFDVVYDSSSTELKILFVSQLGADQGRRIGVTHLLRDQHGWLVKAEIEIATLGPAGEALPPSLIAGIARHEVGHALGLVHSTNTGDVMYPESTTSVISAADRATLNLLYRLPPGVVKQ